MSELRNGKRNSKAARWETADMTDANFVDSMLLFPKEIHVDFLVTDSILSLTR